MRLIVLLLTFLHLSYELKCLVDPSTATTKPPPTPTPTPEPVTTGFTAEGEQSVDEGSGLKPVAFRHRRAAATTISAAPASAECAGICFVSASGVRKCKEKGGAPGCNDNGCTCNSNDCNKDYKELKAKSPAINATTVATNQTSTGEPGADDDEEEEDEQGSAGGHNLAILLAVISTFNWI